MPSARDIAFIGCRLLALYFLYSVLQSLPYSLVSVAGAFAGYQPQDMQQLFYQASQWLLLASPILSLAMVLLLWFGAGWLSREIAEGTPAATHAWSPRSLLSVGVVLLGLVLLSFALPSVVLYLLFLADGAADAASFQIYNLVSFLAQGLVGIGLILGAQRIVDTIARLRRW